MRNFILFVTFATLSLSLPSSATADLLIAVAGQAEFDGKFFTGDQVIRVNVDTGDAELFLDLGPFFGTNEQLDGIAVRNNGNLLFSLGGPGAVGELDIDQTDFVELNPVTGGASIFFDGPSFGITSDVASLHERANGHLLLSFNGTVNLSGQSFSTDDVVDYDPATGLFSLLVDFSNFFAAPNERVVAIGELPDGRLLLSTLDTVVIEATGQTFLKNDIFSHDLQTEEFSLYYSAPSGTSLVGVHALIEPKAVPIGVAPALAIGFLATGLRFLSRKKHRRSENS